MPAKARMIQKGALKTSAGAPESNLDDSPEQSGAGGKESSRKGTVLATHLITPPTKSSNQNS